MKNKYLVVVSTLPISLSPDREAIKKYCGYYQEEVQLPPVIDLIKAIGNNTGNYFFNEAVVKQLGYENCDFINENDIVNADENFLRERVFHGYKTIIYPSANLIRNHDIPFIRTLLDKIMASFDGQLFILGLGSQLSEDQKPNKDILYTLAKAAERSFSIGVRGEQTADILKFSNIKNVEVVGCPSAFLSLNPFFRIEKGNIDADQFKYLYYGELEKIGIDFILRQKSGKLVLQNEPMFFYDYPESPHVDWKQMDLSKTISGIYENISEENYLLLDERIRSGLIFSSIHDWLLKAKEFNFSYGPRFHGNMAALQAGVPALFICHDNRTKELVDYLNLPGASYSSVENKSPLELYEQVDYSSFNRGYPLLYSRYKTFFDNNKIENLLPDGNQKPLILYDIRREPYENKIQMIEKEKESFERELEAFKSQNENLEGRLKKYKRKTKNFKKLIIVLSILLVALLLMFVLI